MIRIRTLFWIPIPELHCIYWNTHQISFGYSFTSYFCHGQDAQTERRTDIFCTYFESHKTTTFIKWTWFFILPITILIFPFYILAMWWESNDSLWPLIRALPKKILLRVSRVNIFRKCSDEPLFFFAKFLERSHRQEQKNHRKSENFE